ncbi:response regulator [Fulvivirgaceae bacterium PWU4]|uniref:Response regulator n=1 Tax=Chryseosolibacter histidini TaxID=2782349 RepID=A0AAP2GPW7_9BACT|nr:response regulator [Chryseosolibacter histidini]MBT1699533.1 response regulator [Chryseosolibacter histidini]
METKICYLIDDDDDDRELFETALYHVTQEMCFMTATSGVEALQQFCGHEDFTPDYIFIDLHMPVIDGKECLAEIKKINRFKDIPVVMYSTSMAQQDIDDTRKLGATAYISKPYSMAQLEKMLQTFFSEYNPKSQAHG